MNETFWDEMYRARSTVWSGNPNAHLLSEASGLASGAALDVGCGEGADAIWLAERGWQVTAVDISTVALERGTALANKVGVDVARRIDWLHVDVTEWVPPKASYDLVSAQFMHLAKDGREALFRRLAGAVAPGGSLLIVGHHPSDLQTTVRRPPSPELFYTAAEIAASLDSNLWEIVVSAARERSALDPESRTVSIHDAVLHARAKNSQ